MRRFRHRNAIGKNIFQKFQHGMDKVTFDSSVRCVIPRSEVPGVNCAGADLMERAQMSDAEVTAFVQKLRSNFSELAALPVPNIGGVIGIGSRK